MKSNIGTPNSGNGSVFGGVGAAWLHDTTKTKAETRRIRCRIVPNSTARRRQVVVEGLTRKEKLCPPIGSRRVLQREQWLAIHVSVAPIFRTRITKEPRCFPVMRVRSSRFGFFEDQKNLNKS